ncbi:Troponin I 4 [Toxocara canis]|uniref:Troponin I 4 n=1 Tax=Toxocara canis TaxID=6265 RepID=A0A0B2UP47_TOXCA|nr:Troponin I 4 [Toxocara canis]
MSDINETPLCPEEEDNIRWGGPMGDDEEDDDTKKAAAERERKKAEVRRRLEEAGRAKKAKKGFLTPERKKKLRKLLMMKAAEDLKQQQMLKEQERQRILQERIIPLPDLDAADDDELEQIAKDMAARLMQLESEHYDINYIVRQKDFEINELTIAVNDLRGKFVKPTLKKVSKTDSKFDKLKKKDQQKVDFRTNLKNVDTKKFALEEEKEKGKAEWKK